MKESIRKNSTSLFITIGVILAHIVVIGLIVSSCSSRSAKKDDGKTGTNSRPNETPEAVVSTPGEEQTRPWADKFGPPVKPPVAPGGGTRSGHGPLYIRSTDPNFGKPLDFSQADRRPPEKIHPSMKKWQGTGIIVDMNSRKVLWERNSDRPMPVASMTKLMTVLLVVEEIDRNPKLSLDTKITVTASAMEAIPPKERSKNQAKKLKPGDVYTVRELLLCTMVISNNDAATQLAEVVDGNVDAFVAHMNRRARALGLNSMTFYTPSGLNDAQGRPSVASAADMVRLAERLLEYPEVFKMFSAHSAVINGNTVPATNDVKGRGIDGMKTGFIHKSGFCLTFSVLRDGCRMIGCVTKFDSAADRRHFCHSLINWAYRQAGAKTGTGAPQRKTPTGGGKKSRRK